MSDGPKAETKNKSLEWLKNLGFWAAILGCVACVVLYLATKSIIEKTIDKAADLRAEMLAIDTERKNLRSDLDVIKASFGSVTPTQLREVLEAVTKNPTAAEILVTRPPVGSIVAWHKNPAGHEEQDATPIANTPPDGWMECNGQVLPNDSKLRDFGATTVPNLNGDPKSNNPTPASNTSSLFLRGSMVSGKYQLDAIKKHLHGTSNSSGNFMIQEGKPGHPWVGKGPPSDNQFRGDETTGANLDSADETRPKNMSVVWIIRVK